MGEDEATGQERGSMMGLIALGVVIAFTSLAFFGNLLGGGGTEEGSERADPTKREIELVSEEELTVLGARGQRPNPPADAMSMILIVTTAVRADHLEPYGADWGRSPFFGELSRTGTVFDDVIAASPYSRTAAVAFLTGTHAATLDMVEPAKGPSHRVLPDEAITLAEKLQAAGWATFGVTANLNLNSDAGMAQGFDHYRNAQAKGFHPRARTHGPTVADLGQKVVEAHLGYQPDRPFLLMVDMIDAHRPLRVPPAEVEKFDPKTPNARYRTAVNLVDGFSRALVESIEELGYSRESNLVVVVLGDHGEGLEEPAHHGEMHGRLLFESSVRVPWFLAGPSVAKGHRVEGLASHVDVMPTLLDLLGVQPPSGIDGRSFAAQVRGDSARTDRTEAFSDTWYFTANRSSIWTETTQCQLDFGTTDLTDAFEDACYDRVADPDFTTPIVNDDLMQRLRAWRIDVSAHVTPAP